MTKRGSVQPTKYDPSAPRASRREQLRQERRRRSLGWNVIILGTVVLFLLAVAWYFVVNQRPGAIPGETLIPDEGAAIYPAGQKITYQHHPPSSGGRYADPAPWGFPGEPVPEGSFVANLARGGVVFLYYCPAACPDLQQQLRDFLKKAPPESTYNAVRILVSAYQLPLDTQIVALAWDHQLNLTQFNEDLMLRWYKRFVDQGPDVQP